MSKRKGVSESGEAATKKLKAESSSDNTSLTKLSFDSAQQCLLSLIYPTTIQNFFANNWEKEPLFIQRKSSEYYGELWTKANLEAIAKKAKLMYDEDVFVFRFSKKDKEPLETKGRATVKSLQKYWKDEKATIMLAKPHRFCEKLHGLQRLLESYFGCCAYTSLRVTPEDSQGQAPGYTRGEEFVLQVEGKACWRLYKPIEELATEDSVDLDESEIGDVIQEYELQPGDLLYFPRGTVFQSTCLAGHHSSHLSIQLYIANDWGRFLSIVLTKAIRDVTKNDTSFRQGLPVNFLSYMSYGKRELSNEPTPVNDEATEASEKGKAVVPKLDRSNVDKQKSFQEKLHRMCDSLKEHLDPHWAADFLGGDFMDERLPPVLKSHVIKKGETNEKPPEDESFVQLTYPDHVRLVLHEPGEDFDENVFQEREAEDEEESDVSEEEEKPKKEKGVKKESDKKDELSERVSKKSKSKTKEQKDEKKKEEEEEMDEGDSSIDLDKTWSDEPCIVVQHSLHNGSDEDVLDKESGLVKFPVHYRDALLILHRSTKPVAVKDLPLIGEERVELAMTLWAEGLLEVKEVA